MVRRGTPGSGEDPADREIDNLVAIPLYLRDRFHGVIVCANRKGGFEDVDDDLLLALGDHAGAALQSERLPDGRPLPLIAAFYSRLCMTNMIGGTATLTIYFRS